MAKRQDRGKRKADQLEANPKKEPIAAVVGQTGEEVKRADWEDVHVKRTWDDGLVRRHPKSKVTVLARPGMITDICDSDGTGIIELMTPDFAVVRFEDGRVEPFFWGEVCLDAVQPDPAYIARAPEAGGLKLGNEAALDSSFEVVAEGALALQAACHIKDAINTLCNCGLPMEDKAKKLFAPYIDALQDIQRKLAELAGRYAAECEL